MPDKEVVVNRKAAKEFLSDRLEDLEIPKDVPFDGLVEVFCQYTESDWYEWLRDNFKCFFRYDEIDWDWIKDRIKHYAEQ